MDIPLNTMVKLGKLRLFAEQAPFVTGFTWDSPAAKNGYTCLASVWFGPIRLGVAGLFKGICLSIIVDCSGLEMATLFQDSGEFDRARHPHAKGEPSHVLCTGTSVMGQLWRGGEIKGLLKTAFVYANALTPRSMTYTPPNVFNCEECGELITEEKMHIVEGNDNNPWAFYHYDCVNRCSNCLTGSPSNHFIQERSFEPFGEIKHTLCLRCENRIWSLIKGDSAFCSCLSCRRIISHRWRVMEECCEHGKRYISDEALERSNKELQLRREDVPQARYYHYNVQGGRIRFTSSSSDGTEVQPTVTWSISSDSSG